MSEVTGTLPCPACGEDATSRFCGRCGALLRPREAAAAPGLDDPPPASDDREAVAGPAGDTTDGVTAATGPRWARRVLLPVLALAVVAVAWQLRPPAPEVVTLGSGTAMGAGGTGVTSDRAVTDPTARWQVAAPAEVEHWGGGWTDVHRVDDTVIATVQGDLVGLDAGTGAVTWRLPWVRTVDGAGGGELLLLATDELAAVDPATGEVGERVTLAAPVHGDQLAVVVGDDLVVSSGPVIGFDRHSGAVRWRRDRAWLEAVSGHLGVVRDDDGLEVVDLRDGSAVFRPVRSPGWAAVAVVDDLLVVADHRLTAYGLADGTVRWRVDTAPGGGGPDRLTAVDGVILARNVDGQAPSETAPPAPWSAVDLAGRPVPLPATVTERTVALAYRDGVWVQSDGDTTTAEREGTVLWRRPVQAGELLAAGGAVLATTPADVRILDLSTGEELASVPPEHVHSGTADEVVLGGCLLSPRFLDGARRLADGGACWSGEQGRRPPPHRVLPGDGVAVVHGATLQGVEADGEERWSVDLGNRGVVPLTPRWLALIDHDRLYGPDPTAGSSTQLLDTRTGRTVAELPLDGDPWHVVGRGDLAAVFTSDVEGGEPRVELWELPTDERTEPRRRWTMPESGGVLLAEDALVRVGSTSITEFDTGDGAVRRRVPLEVRVAGGRALHADVLVAAADRDRVVGLGRDDGSLRWELALSGPLLAAPTIAGDVAYLSVGPREVVIVGVHDGAVLGVIEVADDLTGPAYAAGGRILVPTTAGVSAFGPELPVSSPAGRPDR